MNALSRLLSPLVAGVNRRIGESTPARELCDKLDGKTAAVRVQDTGLALGIRIRDQLLSVVPVEDVEPDVIITGSLLALGRLAGDAGDDLVRRGTIELRGDATVADDLRRLLSFARPDWEEQLSGLVGDTAAHGLGDVVRNVARWGRGARETLEQNIGEYLQEESRTLPSRYEVDAFRERVHELRDDVARLEQHVSLLERSAGPDQRDP